MDTMEARHRMPLRPGLPLDPVLQLWAGSVTPARAVVWTGGSADPVALPNAARVALFVQQSVGAGEFALALAPGPVSLTSTPSFGAAPVVLHCRDYPGLVQGAWVGTGMVGTTVLIWEYILQGYWGQ